MQAFPESVRWYATLLLTTWAFAPFVRALAAPLPDRGAFIAKPVGLLAAIWPLWFFASVAPLPFRPLLLWLTVALAGLLGWGWLIRRKRITRDWLMALVLAEVVTLLAFTGYLGLRGFTPDIAGTEKPMDIALLSASARAVDMPPPDPWMAGETINYYYLGYLIHGSVSRMSDVPTPVGFNLALATTFAMTIAAAGGLGYGIARTGTGRRAALAAGAFAAFFVTIAGNLRAPLDLLRDPSGTWHAFWWQGPGWEASRVVIDHTSPYPETINEFPSFSFILGDLHPHVMALPFTVAALALAVALFRRGRPAEGQGWWERLWPMAATGAVIGALYPMNSWDYPTYLAAAGIALLLALGRRRETLIEVAVLAGASVLAWAPFWVTFVPFAGSGTETPSWAEGLPGLPRLATTVAAYRGERTSVGEFFTIFGVAWLITVTALATELWRVRGREGARVSALDWVALGLVALAAIAIPAPVLILAGIPLGLALRLLPERDPDEPGRTILAVLCAAGFGLIVLTEFFYIQDVFNGRMNTLFKVYYQVWTLLGIASALALLRLWGAWSTSRALPVALATVTALAVVAGLAYPIVSAKAWTEWRGPRHWAGLDGATFIGELAPDDLAAIRWLEANAREGDVIAEAPGCSYQVNGGVPTSRMAAFTGVPTVIGWAGHERQWRGGQPALYAEIEPRGEEVTALYASPEDAAALERYGITLLFVGSFELGGAGEACPIAGPYPSVLQPGFPGAGWEQVFASGQTRIYRRTP